MGYCRDCRFYGGSECSVDGRSHSGTSSCGTFVDFKEVPEKKYCRTCRFYDGECSADGRKPLGTSTCGKWSAFN